MDYRRAIQANPAEVTAERQTRSRIEARAREADIRDRAAVIPATRAPSPPVHQPGELALVPAAVPVGIAEKRTRNDISNVDGVPTATVAKKPKKARTLPSKAARRGKAKAPSSSGAALGPSADDTNPSELAGGPTSVAGALGSSPRQRTEQASAPASTDRAEAVRDEDMASGGGPSDIAADTEGEQKPPFRP